MPAEGSSQPEQAAGASSPAPQPSVRARIEWTGPSLKRRSQPKRSGRKSPGPGGKALWAGRGSLQAPAELACVRILCKLKNKPRGRRPAASWTRARSSGPPLPGAAGRSIRSAHRARSLVPTLGAVAATTSFLSGLWDFLPAQGSAQERPPSRPRPTSAPLREFGVREGPLRALLGHTGRAADCRSSLSVGPVQGSNRETLISLYKVGPTHVLPAMLQRLHGKQNGTQLEVRDSDLGPPSTS